MKTQHFIQILPLPLNLHVGRKNLPALRCDVILVKFFQEKILECLYFNILIT